uniref:trithorax group protein osa-like n=1 Tax=Erigeron canadensis TaxID=72917 RepID=UPI001CB8CF96|nr:trithorax group protein osa-like [Erigeron canadensis]XP_043635447.1 trithorax group protein osa-like [Erigeron canadensis]
MGFDNECILNIQSLAGEYFCPVCRTLVYPHEAVQTQCTHLYCKPCLSYVVSSTQACPYDGYLVTEAGSKPLMECNKALAETIGKTTVHCLYHRSGCVWQGPLSDCTTHCSGCAFGNSPVVCNRCGIHIVHRQVQEHAQTCNANGTNTQSQPGGETTQVAASSGVTVPTDHSKIANQATAPASQPQASHTATGPSAVQNVNQPATVNPPPQAMPANAVPTPDQQYYQQYQQYYQQYPGYDPYQQGYQQYYMYQQPPAQQFQPQPQLQQQLQAPGQLQPQVQPQMQPQTQTQAQSQISANGQPQSLYSQSAVVGSSQNQAQVNPPHANPGGPPLPQGHMPPPSYSQAQPYPAQNHAQPHMQAPQFQQPHPQINHSQPSQVQPPPYPQAQPQFQPHLQPQPQLQPLNPQHPPVQSVGHLPYSQQAPQQQHPMQVQSSGSLLPGQMQAQFPPPPPHMRPLQPPHMLPPQQRPIMQQVQQPMSQQYMQQPQTFTGQAPGQLQGQPHHAGSFAQQISQVNPPGPPQPMQQLPLGYVQPQQGTALPPHSSQSYIGQPGMLNQGGQSLQFPQSSVVAGIPPHVRPPHNVSMTNQPPVYLEQQHNQYAPPARRAEDRSPSLKKHEPVANDSGANVKDVKSEAVINDERKSGNGGDIDQRKDESRDGDSMLLQRVKEESKERTIDHSPGGKSSQNKTEDGGASTTDSEVKNGNAQQGQIGDVSGGFPSKGTEHGRSPHPHMPHGHSGQQQRPAAPASHLRPLGPGYFPHPGEHFHPPGPSQHGPFPSEGPFSGPPGPGSTIYGNDSRSYDLRPPLGNVPHPHGPDPRLLGPMESDMYQNQRPPHYDSRRPDSYLSGNVDRGPYGQPFGVESNSTRMNGGPPLSHDSSLAPGFRDHNFKNPDAFPMGPTRYHDQGELKGTLKQFPGPPHLGSEGSPKFGNHSSRPIGVDGPSRFLDKDPHGYDYHSADGLHPGDSGGRPLPVSIHDDNRGRFDNNRHNPDFFGPMHGFGRHNRDRLPPGSPGNPSRPFRGPHNVDFDGREMERHPFGNRFPMGPPGHMHRGEFDGPPQPRSGEPFGPRGRGEPGIGFFQEYGRPGESNGPGGFSHQPPFGELYGIKSTGPHLGEPGFRSSYSRQGFPSDGGFFAGGPDSFDPLRKRKTSSMGWCRICKVDCESVEGLDMHGQTREHQRMSMDMVISIKQKNAKKQKAFNDHSPHEEASKFRKPESNARANMS